MSKFPNEFRVWDGEKMHYPKKQFESSVGPYHINQNGLCYIDGVLQNIQIMFWTGTVDSLGNRIYDQDIIKYLGIIGIPFVGMIWWDIEQYRWMCGDLPLREMINHRDDLDGGVKLIGNTLEGRSE